MNIELGPELFRFETHIQWINKARSWYQSFGVSARHTIAVDQRGRICAWGAHFSRAAEDGAYPVVVYLLDTDAAVPTLEELAEHRERCVAQLMGESGHGRRS